MLYWLRPRTWIRMWCGCIAGGSLLLLFPLTFLVCRVSGCVWQHMHGPVKLKDKVVLITGASSGIGRCMAIEYAKRGAKLVLCARREAMLREVAEDCRDCGGREVAICVANVTREDDCRRMINFTVSTFGHLDVVVNNAGATCSKLFESYSEPAEFRYIVDVDLWGSIYITKYALEPLRRTKGQIIVNTSATVFSPYPYLTLYSASKSALVSFYDTLRAEPIGRDITITIAFPGFVDSEMTANALPGHIPKWWPMLRTETAASAIVEAGIERRRYIVIPRWYSTLLYYHIFFSELLAWTPRIFLLGKPPTMFVKMILNAFLGEKLTTKTLQAIYSTSK